MKTHSVGGLYLNAQVVVTASGLCSGVHFAQRQHSDTRQKQQTCAKKYVSSNPRAKIRRAVQPVTCCCELNRSHGSPQLLLPRSLCCVVGSWRGLSSRQSVREAAHRLPRHPPSLCSNLPPPCSHCFCCLRYRSLLQLNKCTRLQLRPHPPGKKKHTKKPQYLTCTTQLPRAHPPLHSKQQGSASD